jgi:hypothetical protein
MPLHKNNSTYCKYAGITIDANCRERKYPQVLSGGRNPFLPHEGDAVRKGFLTAHTKGIDIWAM